MNNLGYFDFSCQNEDKIIDFSNPEGMLVISKTQEEKPTQLQKANQRLIELIIAYKIIQENHASQKIIDQILLQVIELLDEINLINYTAFCVYFQVLKFSFSAYKEQKKTLSLQERKEVIKEILDNYIKYRHNIYLSYGYNDQVLQIMSDCSSSRRNGKSGIIKIEEIIIPLGYEKINSLDIFKRKEKAYILPDKGGKKVFNQYLKENKVQFVFGKKRDNKYPDALIKIGEEIFIVEHKMTNGQGGSQNAEINEIISFIAEREKNNKIHYVSCLQGDFIKNLSGEELPLKNKFQYENIVRNLEKNKSNFFVNGKGFEKLMLDYTKNITQ